MKHAFGFILIAWVAFEQILRNKTDLIGIALLLGVLCLLVIKEKYYDKTIASVAFIIFSFFLSLYDSRFIIISGIPLIDLAYSGKYVFGSILLLVASLCSTVFNSLSSILPLIASAFIGLIIGTKDRNEKNHIAVIDNERHLRYNLELMQNELIKSKKEIEHLTEIRERNRIAHEIHDNIGHGIAGVIFQLEAALRIIHKDRNKVENILNLCSEKLAETLELTRNTVSNMKADDNIGLDSIERIIKNFGFCSVKFVHSGDFGSVSVTNMKILEANIKEALTNASRHSNAKNIEISIDIGKKNIRLYYRDDGIGCVNISENLGLSGMRDRVRNAGGTFSVDGKKGFIIVCNLPERREEYEET